MPESSRPGTEDLPWPRTTRTSARLRAGGCRGSWCRAIGAGHQRIATDDPKPHGGHGLPELRLRLCHGRIGRDQRDGSRDDSVESRIREIGRDGGRGGGDRPRRDERQSADQYQASQESRGREPGRSFRAPPCPLCPRLERSWRESRPSPTSRATRATYRGRAEP